MYPSVFATRGALLDFGCSMGNNTGDFLDFDYTGLDLDASKIEAARSRWAGRANVRFECGDILVMPERKARFDHVLFASVGHHLSDEQMPLVIEALLGTLRPGGELHFFDPLNQPGKDRFTTRLIMRNDQGKFMRTVQQYDAMFAPYPVVERRIFPSPDGKPVKLQDMLYLRLRKDAA
jgi:SAM-dependent methyltransferase